MVSTVALSTLLLVPFGLLLAQSGTVTFIILGWTTILFHLILLPIELLSIPSTSKLTAVPREIQPQTR